jgi:hypothetical protein
MEKNMEKNMSEELTGILMPHLKHQFILRVGVKDQDIIDTFAKQVLSVKLDYRNNTLDVIVEQPLRGGALHQFVYEWVHSAPHFSPTYLEIWTSGENPTYIMRLLGLECISHEFELGYEHCASAYHKLRFKFQSLAMRDIE